MGTITLPNFRTTADVTMNTRLKDGGVAIDWAGLSNIKAWLYSDAQKAIAGRCDVSIDQADSTKLVCLYSASKPQYLGVQRLIVQAKYLGQTKTYDVPAFNFVSRTAAATGSITIDEPTVDVCIEVTDTTSSILDAAIAAALAAAADAEHAAHLIPNQVLLDCEAATAVALTAASKAPLIGENGNWWVWNSVQEAYVDTGKQAKGDTGNGIASFSVVESEEDDADNVVTVTFTDGTTETFNVKNGKTGNGIASIVQTVESPDDAGTNVITVTMTNGTVITFNVKNGSKGQPGAAQAAYKSVAELPTASAETMDKIYLTPSGTSGVYNMSYTDYDGSAYSWVSLGTTAIQLSDYAKNTDGGEIVDFPLKNYSIQEAGTFGTSNNYKHAALPVKEGDVYWIAGGSETVRAAYATRNAVSAGGDIPLVQGTSVIPMPNVGQLYKFVIPAGCAYLLFNASGNYGTRCFRDLGNKVAELDEKDEKLAEQITAANTESAKNDELTRENFKWQYVVGPYLDKAAFNSSNKIVSTSTGNSILYIPCTKGQLFMVEVQGDVSRGILFSSQLPAIDVVGTLLKDVPSGEKAIIVAPNDGYLMAHVMAATRYVIFATIPNAITGQLFEHQRAVEITTTRTIVAAPSTSENYGESVSYATVNWGASDYVDVSMYSHVALYTSYTTAGFVRPSNVGGGQSIGAVFYDEQKNPIAGIPTIFMASVSRSNYSIYQVPSGAKYMRFSTYTTNRNFIGFNRTAEEGVTEEQVETMLAGYVQDSEFNGKVSSALATDAKTISSKTIFETNPDTDMLQKMVLAKKKKNNGASGESNVVPLVFAHISDAHGGSAQYARYIEFANHWKTKGYIDELIDTGDVVLGTYGDGVAWRNSIEGVEDVITVVGNHDTRASSAEQSAESLSGFALWNHHSAISADSTKRKDAYNMLMVGPDSENPYINNWGVTQPSNAADNGLCYFYKDYTTDNRAIRLIALDVMGYDATQHAWFQDLLADAVTNELQVVVLAHFTGTAMDPLKCNYTSLRTTGEFSGSYSVYLEQTNPGALAEAVDAFQTAGGTFIGYIIGHYHRDMVNVVTGYPKQLVFAVSSGGKANIRDFTKVSGCKSYDDFQIISINTEDKTVRLIKVGADTDYYSRKKGTLCASYEVVTVDGVDQVKGVIGEGW